MESILLWCFWVNPLPPGAFCQKKHFLDILEIFRLGIGQINFNLVKKTFAMTACLSFHWHHVLGHFGLRMCINQNFEIIVLGQESDLHL